MYIQHNVIQFMILGMCKVWDQGKHVFSFIFNYGRSKLTWNRNFSGMCVFYYVCFNQFKLYFGEHSLKRSFS